MTVSDETARTLEFPAASPTVVRTRSYGDRLKASFLRRRNQKQAIRFLVVGSSGYVVNTIAFWIFLHAIGFDYKAAFVVAFFAGCANNFVWNRTWTFQAQEDRAGKQAIRFMLVSALVALCAYGIMVGLVAAFNMWKVPANAVAWIITTPASFVVQKLWSFKA